MRMAGPAILNIPLIISPSGLMYPIPLGYFIIFMKMQCRRNYHGHDLSDDRSYGCTPYAKRRESQKAEYHNGIKDKVGEGAAYLGYGGVYGLSRCLQQFFI